MYANIIAKLCSLTEACTFYVATYICTSVQLHTYIHTHVHGTYMKFYENKNAS